MTVQVMHAIINGEAKVLEIPNAKEMVLPGIYWGAFDELLTPAYWMGQAWQHQIVGTYKSLRLGNTLIEETAACMLGGYGMRAELGLAAFASLREKSMLTGTPCASSLEDALSKPFIIYGKPCRYRFPKQKAQYLSACLAELNNFTEPKEDSALRDKLVNLPGIGLKTASWIVRNYRKSDSVAIIDVHIIKAGRYMKLFSDNLVPEKNYLMLEQLFLKFANAINASAGMLDGLMWDYMKRLGSLVIPIKRSNLA